jgi:hypothetical protein
MNQDTIRFNLGALKYGQHRRQELFWQQRVEGRANREEATVHLRTYRDESCSRHFDLICGRERPWSIDLVLLATSGMLSVGFACALMVPFASTISSWIH